MTEPKTTVRQQGYDEDKVVALKPMEHIRKRPGMYVGGTDERALHHLIYEVVDNSIDEALAGRCDHIVVVLCKTYAIALLSYLIVFIDSMSVCFSVLICPRGGSIAAGQSQHGLCNVCL